MAKILILGGYGMTGKLLARHLLEESDAEIIIAGRHLEKARIYTGLLNGEFTGERVSAHRVDAADIHSLHDGLADADLLLVAAPTTQYAEAVIHAALDCGVDYLDVQLDTGKLAILTSLAAQIQQSGRCFITEAGFHPGLPSALVRYAASHLDRLEKAVIAGYLNMGPTLPYTEAVDELMELFKKYEGSVFRNGQWTASGWQKIDIRTVDFGGEIGARKCFSMFFEELRALPKMYPTLKEVGFYMSETHWALDWVISSMVFLGLKLAPHRGIRPMGRLMWWGMQTFPKPPYLVLLKVDAYGEKNGRQVKVEAAVSHPDGYELTAIPVIAYLLQYLDGSARCPGLRMMGHAAEPVRLFKDLERMGVRTTCTIG
jgi:saccharopine dehydrogenase-like NADP-dependent oxidoreductase